MELLLSETEEKERLENGKSKKAQVQKGRN